MKRYNNLNIVQALVILLLLITNYYSYFHHDKSVIFIDDFINQMKLIYYKINSEMISFIKWISYQEYDFSFNNREIAIGCIFFVAVIAMIINKDIRKSLANLMGALFNKHFNRVYIEIFLYTLLMVSVLYKFDYWKFIYMKDTLLWIFFSALYLSFKVADDKGNEKLFINILKDAVGVTVIIEFLLNTFTFSIILEIIVIVLIIFLAIIIAFTEAFPDKDKNGQVKKLMTGINTYIGLNILLFLTFEVLNNLDSLLTLDTLRSFMLPIIFTVMFIPYLFYLLMRVSFEQLNVPIKLNKVSNKWIIYYFKIRMYLHCRFSRKKIIALKKFKSHLIINMKTKDNVDNIFI